MRALTRNKQRFSYCLLVSANAAVVDENGNRTGETVPVYSEVASMEANVSPASGYAQTEQFGELTDYDHVIVTDWLDCPITESTVLFLEKEPEYRTETVQVYSSTSQSGHTTMTAKLPLYDYIVRRVSRSLHSVSIAVKKAEVA